MSPRVRPVLAGALAVALAACAEPPPPPSRADDPRPDVVLVVLDTLRPDHLELFGHERMTAPFLSSLARGATVFPRAFSTSSKTTPATASVMTGTYPTRHNVLRGLEVAKRHADKLTEDGETRLDVKVLPPDMTLLAELFRGAGYRTFGLSANTQVNAAMGYARGFERFECLDWTAVDDSLETLVPWEDEIRASTVPVFVYLHLIDPHHPYHRRTDWFLPRRGEDIEKDRARYESEIRFLDDHLAELFGRFDWAERALVAVVSDHGEEFLDHGKTGHRFSLYDELNRVLFLVRPPGAEGPPRESAETASLVDVLPTLLELVGRTPPEDRHGRSLAAAVRGEPGAARDPRTVFAHRAEGGYHMWAAIRFPWKLIQVDEDKPPMLFDLAADPEELEDLAGDHPDVVDELLDALDEHRRDAFTRNDASVEIRLDSAEVDDLRALGYVDDGE